MKLSYDLNMVPSVTVHDFFKVASCRPSYFLLNSNQHHKISHRRMDSCVKLC